jgi:predicted nucleotidyltransferase
MDENDRALVLEFKNRLTPELSAAVRRIIVFGSRARGSAATDSDLDVIALVDKKTPSVERALEDVAYQVMWDHDFKPMISLKVFEQARYVDAVNRGFSFYRHVEHEGVAV